MKKCIFLLLSIAIVIYSCTTAPDKNLQSRIADLEYQINEIEEQLNKEIKKRKAQYEDLNKIAQSQPSSRHQPKPTPMRSTTEEKDKSQTSDSKTKIPKQSRASLEKELYSRALDLLLAKNQPQKAQEKFKKFLEKYPQSSLVPNTYYWMGESYYAQKKFEQSILYFKKVYNRFPADPKSPDALLKTGYAYAQKGDISNAKFYLNNLIERNPDSKAAELARRRLRSLN